MLLAAHAALWGCGREEEAAASARPAPPRTVRDARLDPVRRALEAGQAARARELLGTDNGFEATCLRARLCLLEGDAVEALRAIEEARALAPDASDLVATEAELLAALQRVEAAREVWTAGVERVGRTAELERARGVIELATSGHAAQALDALQRARALDPELPFLRFPLAQAHVLAGRALLERSPGEALAHAVAARTLEPELACSLLGARELQSEALAATMRFEEALAIQAELAAEGEDVGETIATLHQRLATRLLVERDRAGAVEHYRAAREAGLGDEGLGFGVTLLAEEARAAIERGIARFEADDFGPAAAEFARALELAPEDLAARNHLAAVRFRQADYRAAAAGWEEVLARSDVIELPEPVHLNLARAWRLAGEPARARAVVDAYLDREPEGKWAEETRAVLAALEAEELAGK